MEPQENSFSHFYTSTNHTYCITTIRTVYLSLHNVKAAQGFFLLRSFLFTKASQSALLWGAGGSLESYHLSVHLFFFYHFLSSTHGRWGLESVPAPIESRYSLEAQTVLLVRWCKFRLDFLFCFSPFAGSSCWSICHVSYFTLIFEGRTNQWWSRLSDQWVLNDADKRSLCENPSARALCRNITPQEPRVPSGWPGWLCRTGPPPCWAGSHLAWYPLHSRTRRAAESTASADTERRAFTGNRETK